MFAQLQKIRVTYRTRHQNEDAGEFKVFHEGKMLRIAVYSVKMGKIHGLGLKGQSATLATGRFSVLLGTFVNKQGKNELDCERIIPFLKWFLVASGMSSIEKIPYRRTAFPSRKICNSRSYLVFILPAQARYLRSSRLLYRSGWSSL